MKLLVTALLMTLTLSNVFGSGMSRLNYAISEAVGEEFYGGSSVIELYDIIDSVEITGQADDANGCDIVYEGAAMVKKEEVLFDACINIEEGFNFTVAISEK
jgi:hypothetical protein